MNELETSIFTLLTGGTALTAKLATTTSIYPYVAPLGAAFPLVIFNLQGGGDTNDTPRRNKDLVYQVKAVSDTTKFLAGEVDTEIDNLLHETVLTVSGWTNYWCARETDIGYQESKDGAIYWHVGGLYRIRLDKG